MFPPIDPDEIKTAEFDFSSEVPSGTTISGAVVACTTISGSDATPEGVLLGVAQVSGLVVLQRIRGKVDGVLYVIRAVATDSDGGKHVISSQLQCARATPQ